MQATIEIPDSTYSELEETAARTGSTLQEVILSRLGLETVTNAEANGELKKLSFPLLHSREPGSMSIGPEGLNEFLFLPLTAHSQARVRVRCFYLDKKFYCSICTRATLATWLMARCL